MPKTKPTTPPAIRLASANAIRSYDKLPFANPLARDLEALRDGVNKLGSDISTIITDTVESAITATVPPLIRVLDINNTAVGNNIAHAQPIYKTGNAVRVMGVLRMAIAADLVVRANITRAGVTTPIITITIPLATAPLVVVTADAFATNPQLLLDGDVLTWDVTASDGSVDINGVASCTLVWQ